MAAKRRKKQRENDDLATCGLMPSKSLDSVVQREKFHEPIRKCNIYIYIKVF